MPCVDLPPMVPGQPGLLGNDGEHLVWINPTGEGQVPTSNNTGQIVFANATAARAPDDDSQLARLVKRVEALEKKAKPKKK